MRILTSALLTLTVISMVGCTTAHVPTETRIAESVPVTEPTVLKASTFEEAEIQCDDNYTGQAWEDCIDAALTSWCMFEPFPPDSEFFTAEDARCIAEEAAASK